MNYNLILVTDKVNL